MFIELINETFFCTLYVQYFSFLSRNFSRQKLGKIERHLYSKTQSFCHPTKKGNTFCQKEALSYPLFMHAPDQKITKAIENIVQKEIKDFDKVDLQKSVLETLDEEIYQPGGTWDTKNALDLFTVTPKTFTMVTDGSGYSGGAHGYFATHYDNYSHEGTPLKLDTLLKEDYNATLHKVAERVYKKAK